MTYEQTDIKAINNKVKEKSAFVDLLKMEINRVIVGQEQMIERLLIALLGKGHILLEGVPGLAKTLAIKTLADAIDVSFSRIQFTPDLLPSDVIGTLIYNVETNKFEVKKGPIFANFVLADEINRAPAKVQSALLEAMQERQVTIGEHTFRLEEPFMVLATQNPIEQEGTYPLPEAQTDRFMLKTIITYPKQEEERLIVRRNMSEDFGRVSKVASKDDILEARHVVREIYTDPKIEQYVLDIVFATRYPEKYGLDELKPLIAYGASPRGSINLLMAAKGHAFLNHRGFTVPEDVLTMAHDVLRHRIGLTYEAEAENITTDDIINKIVNSVQIP